MTWTQAKSNAATLLRTLRARWQYKEVRLVLRALNREYHRPMNTIPEQPPEGFIISRPRAHRARWAKANPLPIPSGLSAADLALWACDICAAPLDPDKPIPVMGRTPEGYSLCPRCIAAHDTSTWPTCQCAGCQDG